MRMIHFFLLTPIAFGTLSVQSRIVVTSTCPTMEVSIVADKSNNSNRHITSPKGELISLTEKPLLTINDFVDANVSLTEGQIVLNVSMSPESAKRVQAFTTNHVGTRIAFVVNGKIINMPKILDPITGKGFLIGPFQRNEAQELADSINQKENGCGAQTKRPS